MAIVNDQVNFNLDALDINLLDEEMPREIKIIVMGEINSGKSSLIQIFFGQQSPVDILSRESNPTIGAEINVFENNDAKTARNMKDNKFLAQIQNAKNATALITKKIEFNVVLQNGFTKLYKKYKIRKALTITMKPCKNTEIFKKFCFLHSFVQKILHRHFQNQFI